MCSSPLHGDCAENWAKNKEEISVSAQHINWFFKLHIMPNIKWQCKPKETSVCCTVYYGMRYAEAKGKQLSILTLVHAMKTRHDSHNSVCVCLSVYVCMSGLYVCFKQYDMSAGSYLEKVYKTDQTPWSSCGSKRRLTTFKKPINQHDNSITKLNCNLWPECTQGNVHYVLRLLRWCVLNV